MKKIIITLMSLLMVLLLVACGNSQSGTSKSSNTAKTKVVKLVQPAAPKTAGFAQADATTQYHAVSDAYNAVNSSYLNYIAAYTQLVQDNMTPATLAQLQTATPHLAQLIANNQQVIASTHQQAQLTKFKATEATWYQAEVALQKVAEQELATLQAVTGANTKREGDQLDQLHGELQTADYATQQAEYKTAVQAGITPQAASQYVEQQRQLMNNKYPAPMS